MQRLWFYLQPSLRTMEILADVADTVFQVRGAALLGNSFALGGIICSAGWESVVSLKISCDMGVLNGLMRFIFYLCKII